MYISDLHENVDDASENQYTVQYNENPYEKDIRVSHSYEHTVRGTNWGAKTIQMSILYYTIQGKSTVQVYLE